MSRRRALALSAAALGTAAAGRAPVRWRGRALGAEVSLTLHAPEAQARPAIAEIVELLERVETAFSLYRDSELTRLNGRGTLAPSPVFADLVARADAAYRATGGLFDPTVQPLWLAQAEGRPLPRHLVGWERVEHGPRIRLTPGQQLTFNGIAQGYATDLARAALHRHGLTDILVNIGEFAADGGPWRLGISDPLLGHVATRTLRAGAIATSSRAPGGLPHIFGRAAPGNALTTVAVEADTATLADALSTAALLADRATLASFRSVPGVRAILTVDQAGNLRTI